jgi:prophage regulatory protein
MERLNRIIRKKELPDFCGLQKTQIEKLIKLGQFPKPITLSDAGRAVAWLEHELIAWQQARIAKRDGHE